LRGWRVDDPLRPLLLIGVVLLALTLGCHLPVAVSSYQGDGKISRIPFLPNPGVRVDFERFSLRSTYNAKYRLEGLPRRPSAFYVGLSVDVQQEDFDQNPKEVTKAPGGVLALRLLSNEGKVLFDCSRTIDRLDWTWAAGSRMGLCLGRQAPRGTESLIYPEWIDSDDPPAFLEVHYDPVPNAPDVVGWIRLSAGGET
jgi:hypothetical protein